MYSRNYQRPVRSELGRCFVGTPDVKNPLTGGTLYPSDNTNYTKCVNYKKPSGAGPSINVGTTLDNPLLKGPAGLCCADYSDVVATGPVLAKSDIVQAVVCGNYEKLPLGIGSMIPEQYRDMATQQVQKFIPANYKVTLPGGLGDRFIPIRSLVCDGRPPMSAAAAAMPPAMTPAELPSAPIDSDW